MKRISILLAGIIISTSAVSFAQDGMSSSTPSTSSSAISQRGLSLSVGPEFLLPVGSFKDAGFKFGLGGSAKLSIPITNNLDATASAGYVVFGASKLDELNDDGAYAFIPFKGGLRLRTNSGWYAEPQAGYTQTKLQNVSEGAGEFTYALNLGYMWNNMLDFSTRYEAVATKGESSKMIGLRIAYNFNFARSK